jgi:predicted RNase H-like nuclease (RuvC/YqgF family)
VVALDPEELERRALRRRVIELERTVERLRAELDRVTSELESAPTTYFVVDADFWPR